MSAFGEVPDMTLSVPRLEIILSPETIQALERFSRAVPEFAQGAEAFAEAVKKEKGE